MRVQPYERFDRVGSTLLKGTSVESLPPPPPRVPAIPAFFGQTTGPRCYREEALRLTSSACFLELQI